MTRLDQSSDHTVFHDLSHAERVQIERVFDADFYLAENPEIRNSGIDPLTHYLTFGWREGRDPSGDFATIPYLLANRDALVQRVNPLIHSLRMGRVMVPSGGGHRCEPSEVGVSGASPHEPHLLEGSLDARTLHVKPTGLEGLASEELSQVKSDFDVAYYLSKNEDVAKAGIDPFRHYMKYGWRELRDPTPEFSTGFYLRCYEDIANSNRNPFVHWVLNGKKENRASVSFKQKLEKKPFNPVVAAIIPNYNHAEFLAQRIDSILAQTYPNITITILDDSSSDDSRNVIDSYVARFPGRISAIYNTSNSGGVFYQWRKGVQNTQSDLIWICESDDFCEPNFLKNLISFFRDESVNLAFGRILETDREGTSNLSLDTYREKSEPGIWDVELVRPAAEWFSNALGVNNVIANVGGCIFRRQSLPDAVWEEAQSYSVVGDWYLYNEIAGGGKIAWSPNAVSYFRRHGSNTSSKSFTGTKFYSELERLMTSLLSSWEIPSVTVRQFYKHVANQYAYFKLEEQYGHLRKYCDLDKLLNVERTRPHILLAIYGFIPGGGENFPIHLANSLVARGGRVSILVFETDGTNEQMRDALSPSVAVYDAAWVYEYGADRFLKETGVSLIHSHTVGAEMHFLCTWKIKAQVRYVVTLHGSYEVSDLDQTTLKAIANGVDHFVYTAEKNLKPLVSLNLPADRISKFPNAMPADPKHFPRTRRQLGIPENAVVFTLVARGIRGKGWATAVKAFTKLRRVYPHQPMNLCLVGEGEEPERLKLKYDKDPDVLFLGYQMRINGLYRISDVAIVPSRFSGESYPLCIIQALQEGTPVIASKIGEISSMLKAPNGAEGGVLIDAVQDDEEFTDNLFSAMESMLDPEKRGYFAKGAGEIGKAYDMDKLAEAYEGIYNSVIAASPESLPLRKGGGTSEGC